MDLREKVNNGGIKLWNEFKSFAMKGNVLDLAVGVIIGGAFGKIVSSLVNDMLMPLIGLLMGGVDFADLAIKIGDEKLKYGAFIQSIVDFFIISFSIFLFIKVINRFKRKEEMKEIAKVDRTEELLVEIRDLLKDFSRKNETS
jgi:large conductance mechanosensitive channel